MVVLPHPAMDQESDCPRQKKSTWPLLREKKKNSIQIIGKQIIPMWAEKQKTTVECILGKCDKSLGRHNQQGLTILMLIPIYCLTSSTRCLNHSPCRYVTTQEREHRFVKKYISHILGMETNQMLFRDQYSVIHYQYFVTQYFIHNIFICKVMAILPMKGISLQYILLEYYR